MAIDVTCPDCGTRDIRTSRARNFRERFQQYFGLYNLRCNRCARRFRGSLWKPSMMHYARCPRCLRTELGKWAQENYNPPVTVTLLLRLGAKPLRCEFCRCNFASFRAVKDRFDRRKHGASRQPVPSGTEANSGAAPE